MSNFRNEWLWKFYSFWVQDSFRFFRRFWRFQIIFYSMICGILNERVKTKRPLQLHMREYALWIFNGTKLLLSFSRNGGHLLTKACSFCVVLLVTNHVSQPYSRTDFTHALNSLILRGRLMFFCSPHVFQSGECTSGLIHSLLDVQECPSILVNLGS